MGPGSDRIRGNFSPASKSIWRESVGAKERGKERDRKRKRNRVRQEKRERERGEGKGEREGGREGDSCWSRAG